MYPQLVTWNHVVFNAQYPHNRPLQALHHRNNRRGIGTGAHVSLQTLRHLRDFNKGFNFIRNRHAPRRC